MELVGGLVIALAGMSIVGVGVDRYLPAVDDPRADLLVSDLSKWAVFLLLCGYVVAVEGRPLSSLSGRSLDPLSFVVVVGGGLLVLLTASVATAPLFDRFGVGDLGEELSELAVLSRPQRIFVALTAGVTEEALFHGYAIERLLEATGSPLLAGTISFAAFTAGHAMGWNRGAVVRIAVPALLTTVMYLLVRDVVALMAIHALNDAAGLLLVRSVSDTAAEESTQ